MSIPARQPALLAPEDDPSWHLYPSTVLEIAGASQLRIDLRDPVTSITRLALSSRGLSGSLAVLTAANPRGQAASGRLNRQLGERLQRLLTRLGCHHVRADGCSPDGQHREPGFVVSLPRDVAVRIARRYGQSALFWFDGEVFWIVGALVDSTPIRLPVRSPPE